MAYAPKLTSGIPAIDEAWGGLYRGGSYLVYGRAVSGRGVLPLMFAANAVKNGERCVYLSTDSRPELEARAASAAVDVSSVLGSDLIQLAPVPNFDDPQDVSDGDLARTLSETVSSLEQQQPERIVVDHFMPFVQFRSFGRFRTSFIAMLEKLDAIDATLMLAMAEPANEQSRKVIEFMRGQMTGAAHVELAGANGGTGSRQLTLIPGIGHAGQETVKLWHVVDEAPSERTREAARRFRFEEESGPSPREGQWDVPSAPAERSGNHTGHGIPERGAEESPDEPFDIAAYRLGSRTLSGSGKGAHSPAEPLVEPIPLGRSGRGSGVSHYDRRSGTASDHDHRSGAAPSDRDRRSGVAPSDKDRRLSSMSGGDDVGFRATSSNRDLPSGRDLSSRASSSDEDLPSRTTTTHTDRAAFRSRLQRRFGRRSDVGPFLLIAMRMDRPERQAARPFDFEFILDLVSELVRDRDDMYVDLDSERMVVMLADAEPEASQRFFAQLKRRLREEAPQQADYLLQSVSAIVTPDGRPFQTAEEFLAYALDEG